MEEEFRQIDEVGSWSAIYQEIRHQSSELPCKFARSPENKCRNRYRDVSPFDHSRILLQLGENDYINASLISMEEAQRNYILTQGPLPNTCGHFWEMVWEQRTLGVVMLNRVIEKGSIKCAQYWPHREERDAIFEDTNLRVTLISEDVKEYYTVRQLELENLFTQETREILHFHYTTWPDFGVPESASTFLNFLFMVRESGCLNADQGPVVVHCSAGIGRSGTFCLVDTCLVLMSGRKDPSSVSIRDVLLEMRSCRMGLIQTADQLRFSYLAVIEGAKCIMGDTALQESWKELSNEEEDSSDFTPPPSPPPPPPPPRPGKDTHNDTALPPFSADYDEIIHSPSVCSLGSQQDSKPRRRNVGELQTPATESPALAQPDSGADTQGLRVSGDATSSPGRELPPPPPLPHQAEEPEAPGTAEGGDKFPGSWSPVVVNVCLCTALAFSAYVCYRACYH
ncbi:hypothetical protein NHX12_012298 [Muraenolepis orangiensis]|uniref:Tyrosine-protein phosphatase non-receptor type n=1 Tax=Muraenolepis orangiensis TaxID=630683 RepID=A0A9Q0DF62_9TELE|nr:hypothetical protein NHX12_012298 [Muraenolepis orangiensis]